MVTSTKYLAVLPVVELLGLCQVCALYGRSGEKLDSLGLVLCIDQAAQSSTSSPPAVHVIAATGAAGTLRLPRRLALLHVPPPLPIRAYVCGNIAVKGLCADFVCIVLRDCCAMLTTLVRSFDLQSCLTCSNDLVFFFACSKSRRLRLPHSNTSSTCSCPPAPLF